MSVGKLSDNPKLRKAREDALAKIDVPFYEVLYGHALVEGLKRSGTPLRFLSFGAGVNSVAALLEVATSPSEKPHLAILADTGEEERVTYEYVRDYIQAFCNEHDIRLIVVKSAKGRMVDYYTENSAVPSMMRRDCTQKFKIAPIRAFLTAIGAKELVKVAGPCVAQLGIAWDESHRVRDSDVGWIKNEFPLIDRKWTRAACEFRIAIQGWPSPGKSGCVGCPFAGRKGLLRLLREDPAEFERWAHMEDVAHAKNPKITLLGRKWTLRDLATSEDAQKVLDVFDGGECLAGVCVPDAPDEPEALTQPTFEHGIAQGDKVWIRQPISIEGSIWAQPGDSGVAMVVGDSELIVFVNGVWLPPLTWMLFEKVKV